MDAELKQFLEAMERGAAQRDQELREYIEERTQQLRRELSEYIEERTQQLRRELSEYIDERTHDTETRIVRAFGAYQQSSGIRFRKLESDLSNINTSTTEQMDAFQAKLLELETRIINLEGPQGSAA
jgi:hypothetical protein